MDRNFYEDAVTIADESMQANEVPVGCIIVYEGEIIGRGHNEVNKRRNSTYHAEMVAIDQVSTFSFKLIKLFHRNFLGI
jgi:tRNA(Arg) A34 adenosine deaminase TadA